MKQPRGTVTQPKRIAEHSGGFTYDKTGKPVFHYVEAVRWSDHEMGAEMSTKMEMPTELVPWYRKMAEALDMDFYDFWTMGLVKSFVVAADEPVTLEMAIHDADCHRLDPTYPLDFSSQLKEAVGKMPDRERILAGLRLEVANFEAYVKARSEWLKKEINGVRSRKEAAEFVAA